MAYTSASVLKSNMLRMNKPLSIQAVLISIEQKRIPTSTTSLISLYYLL